MGPFSDELQHKRAMTIQTLLKNPSLSEEWKAVWQKKLINLAMGEDEYNARVKQIYSNTRSGIERIL
jgi:hypothetical protein